MGIKHAARTAGCRTWMLAALWLHACGRGWANENTKCQRDVADLQAELEAERSKNSQLQAQLQEARSHNAMLQEHLDSAIRSDAATDYAEPALRVLHSHIQQPSLASCPLPPIVNETLPRGSYMKSCESCYRFGDSLRCSCFTRSQVDPRAGLLLPVGNMTGVWSLQDDDWDSSTRLELTTVDISGGMARFRILCTDGGVAYHCSADHPGHNGTDWHQGEGVVEMTAAPSIRCNPNARPPETCPSGGTCPKNGICAGHPLRHVSASFDNLFRNNGTVDVNYTTISWNDSSVWKRVPATGVTTAMSLSACVQPPYIYNRNGYLSCDWKNAPPPRVGGLIGNLSNDSSTCRVLKQYTFTAEQYRRNEGPLAVFPIMPNVSWHPLWNISGVWQSFTRDHAMMMDEMEIVLTASHGDLHNFSIVCLDGGPSRTCTPGDGPVWNWHNATGILNLTALGANSTGGYHATVLFQGMKVANQGIFNNNFTTLSWFDHSTWRRKNVNQETDCCAHCTNHPDCRGWTLDVEGGTCSLVDSSSNAYPSAKAISGYPLNADPAAWCKQRFLDGSTGGGVAYQDPDMAAGIECAVAVPQDGDTPSSSINFPRPWRDTERHHRGSAWLFFPSQEHSWQGHLDGIWTSGEGSTYTLQSAKGLTKFTVECVHAGVAGVCDDQHSEGINGTLWHAGNGTLDVQSGNATVNFDNGFSQSGRFEKGYGKVFWSDGSSWHRQPKCNCACHPRDDYNCYKMRCYGPELTDDLAKSLIAGKKWIVFFHGGEFRYYDDISGNYAMLSSRIAKDSGMGVLAVDYRTTDSNNPHQFPEAIHDVIDGFEWLKSMGASELYLYGDSSGATQAVQTMLWMEHHRLKGMRFGFNITATVLFSAWLDLTSSNPTYDSNRHCTGDCFGIGDASFTGYPGINRLHAMCASRPYAGNLPINHPTLSPLQAPEYLLGRLPPMMLFVGSAEVLLGDNLQFVQKVAGAGGSAQLEVYDGMWHDFQMSSEGCASGHTLAEGVHAMAQAGKFLKAGGWRCHVACSKGGPQCTGAAPVKWHYHHNELPPPLASDCPGGVW